MFVWDAWEGRLTRIDAHVPQDPDPAEPLDDYATGRDNLDLSDLAVDEHAPWVTNPIGNAAFKIEH